MTAKTPAQAWHELLAGNVRFVKGTPVHPNQDLGRRASAAAEPQRPFAAIFGCMDSRVAAEIVFDRGLGDLAVIRTAGHTVDNAVLGSLEFGVVGLQIPLIVVLGHDNCGAVNAAVNAYRTGQMPKGYLRDLVERLSSSLVTTRLGSPQSNEPDTLSPNDTVMAEHVRHTVHLLAERSVAIAERLAQGQLAIVGAEYRLSEGQVRLVDSVGTIDSDPAHPTDAEPTTSRAATGAEDG